MEARTNAMRWSPEQLSDIKAAIFKNATDSELRIFAHLCKEKGLNPFAKQIYAMKYGSNVTYIVSIDGFRLVAQRTGEYQGQEGPYFCGQDGKWTDIWTKKEFPYAAKVGVMRKGFTAPLYATAIYDQYKQDRNPLWKKMSSTMIAKCAEAQALRRAFPGELGGVYESSEMDQAKRTEPEETKVEPEVISYRPAEAPVEKEEVRITKEILAIVGKTEGIWTAPITGDAHMADGTVDSKLVKWVQTLLVVSWRMTRSKVLHEIAEYIEEHNQCPLEFIEGLLAEEVDHKELLDINKEVLRRIKENDNNTRSEMP
jgi:phage recombination protein Bet